MPKKSTKIAQIKKQGVLARDSLQKKISNHLCQTSLENANASYQ